MRDYLIFAIVLVLLLMTFKNPVVGILTFTWLSLMNPHRLTYGAAYDFPFAAIVGGVTLLSLLASKRRKQLPLTPVTFMLAIFIAWMTFTSFFALEPGLVWREWNRVTKTLFMVLVAILALNSEKEIKAFAWVTGLSLGYYGLKGGIFTLASGGSYHVFGPEGSYINDNNALALALVTSIPIIWFLQLHAGKRWMRVGLTGLILFTVISSVGSYSRGALLAAGAMFAFLWLKSRKKLLTAVALILLVLVVYAVMPEQWFARMATIDKYQDDASTLGRFNAWHFAINVATQNPLGGGYSVFTRNMFHLYAPEPLNYHVAHSIYFQVLGEHGFLGLAIFILLMICAWRTGTRVIRFCKGKPEIQWASDLAAMCQVSIIGYAVGGAFLSLAYYDLYYDIIALLVLLEKLLLPQSRPKGINSDLSNGAAGKGRNRDLPADEKTVLGRMPDGETQNMKLFP